MESEKVKEIKEYLEEEVFIATEFGDKLRRIPTRDLQKILTLINELESENERLLDSVETVQNNRCVYKCELTKKQLRQFAERLKEKSYPFPCAIGVEYAVPYCKIDETLKEYEK